MTRGAIASRIIRSPGSKALRNFGRHFASRWPWPVRTDVRGLDFYVDLRSSVGRGIFVTGQFDQAVYAALEPSLTPGAVLIDVGANIGYYSVLASRDVGENGAVHAFEIDPRPLRCLRKTIRSNGLRNIHLHEVAVGAHEGHSGLRMQPDCGHSYVDDETGGMRVPMASLDSWLRSAPHIGRVDAIKIDVEGGEVAVLQGALDMLNRFRPRIVCEAYERGGCSWGSGCHPSDAASAWIRDVMAHRRVQPNDRRDIQTPMISLTSRC